MAGDDATRELAGRLREELRGKAIVQGEHRLLSQRRQKDPCLFKTHELVSADPSDRIREYSLIRYICHRCRKEWLYDPQTDEWCRLSFHSAQSEDIYGADGNYHMTAMYDRTDGQQFAANLPNRPHKHVEEPGTR